MNDQIVITLANILGNNIGSRLTVELANGIVNSLNNALNQMHGSVAKDEEKPDASNSD